MTDHAPEAPTLRCPPLTWVGVPTSALAPGGTLADEWDRLNRERADLPILSAQAVHGALSEFGSGRERLMVARSRDGEVLAMVLVVSTARLQWATFQPSQLPLGCWVAAVGLDLDALARSLLCSGRLGFALALSITQVDPLMAMRQEDTTHTRHDDYIPTAWIDVRGGFDDYWAARGKNLRQNLRKQRNKLDSEGVRTERLLWTTSADIGPALARYGELEGQGWKAEGGTAILAANAQGRFYRGWLTAAAQRGEALCTEYQFDGRTVAMNLGLVRGGTWIVLKTAYDESVPKNLSPASLLREEELQWIFGEGSGIRRIEYYGRMMEWHTRLTETHRTLYHLTAYRFNWVKLMAERRRARSAAAESSATPQVPADPA